MLGTFLVFGGEAVRLGVRESNWEQQQLVDARFHAESRYLRIPGQADHDSGESDHRVPFQADHLTTVVGSLIGSSGDDLQIEPYGRWRGF